MVSGASVCVLYCLHDDFWFVEPSIKSFSSAGPVIAFVSRLAWNGEPGAWERCAQVAKAAGAEVVVGDWPNESLHRQIAIEEARQRGYSHALTPDGDEIVEPRLLSTLLGLAGVDATDVARVSMETYWKSPRYAIRPPEQLRPVLLVNLERAKHAYIREYEGPRLIVLGPDHGVLHHLSYAGPDARIERKLSTWGHRSEVVTDWYRRVWKAWDRDRLMRDLHPTHPSFYGCIERIPLPAPLQLCEDNLSVYATPERPAKWPTVSLVIPLYGGGDDLRNLLVSLRRCEDLLHEVIVVDDQSPDQAAAVAEEFEFVTLIRNPKNLGFAGTCNVGYRATSGDVVIFLNSDTVVPRAGLIRLIESLTSSSTIGAAGPYTSYAGGEQMLKPTYQSLATLDLFADDFAHRSAEDRDVPLLTGFCLAVRRSAMEEVGLFDERFGRGMFEDNDLCYRLLRAGWRLRLSARAWVHHEGTKSMPRSGDSAQALLARNQWVYVEKWRAEVESGFASHLPGDTNQPVRFNLERHPDRLRADRERLKELADISLCMIVKNEERVLDDCLSSVRGVFSQIVVVDTGSTDRTREIALSHGVDLVDFPWTESFAEARNVSLAPAKGRWVMWMDADDTLPPASADAILNAAVNAPDEIVGFVIPVRFTDGGTTGGTQVDHVKLFRRVPGLAFEGRIHEQVLSSLRPHGEIARLDGAVVLHSGYDTSDEGQARKRVRDARLLELDLAERPNHPFVLFNLGMTAHYNGDHPAAVDWLRRSIAAAQPNESHIRKAYSLMGVSLREMEQPLEALAAFDEGLAAVGADPELHFQAALVLTALNRLEEARERYLAMPLDASGHFSSLDVGILGPKRLHNLGSVCAGLDRYSEARQYLGDAMRAGFAPSAHALVDLAAEREDLRTMREALDSVYRSEGPSADWAMGRARFAELRGENPLAELAELTRQMPHAVGPRLALMRRLLREGRVSEAGPLMAELDEAGIAEAAYYRSVEASRRGEYADALIHARRALRLDPQNPGNAQQVNGLLRALASEREGKDLLGPSAGDLSPAGCSVSAVVVTFNSADLVRECAEAVLAQLGPDDELIFVENASADATSDVLTEIASDPRVRVLPQPENLGYARAANVGVRASRGENVLLLNPDAMLSPGCLARMLRLVDVGVGAVVPLADNVGGEQFVGHHLPVDLRPPVEALAATVDQLHGDDYREVKMVMGLCLLLPRGVLNACGLLYVPCELGADDLEISWRLRRCGYVLRVARGAFVRHVGHASFNTLPSPERAARIQRSDMALVTRLTHFYGPSAVPSSMDLWGDSVFEAALGSLVL